MTPTKTMDRSITIGGYVFNEKKHVHQLDGKNLTGVTTVLGVIAKPMLIGWSANTAVDYIKEKLFPDGKKIIDLGDDITVKFVEETLKEARTAHTKKKEKAGDWGTIVHACCEVWATTGNIPATVIVKDEEVEVKEEHKKAVDNFVKWATDNKVKFLANEKHVYSREWWCGGICDIICEIDGKRYVGDIKTGKGIYPEAFIQCSAYAKMLKEMGEYEDILKDHVMTDVIKPAFDGVVVINLKKDGGFDVQFNYDLAGNQKCFESALNIYRQLNAITK